eukprot:5672364-Alexandrium_andersonii.AAC.1
MASAMALLRLTSRPALGIHGTRSRAWPSASIGTRPPALRSRPLQQLGSGALGPCNCARWQQQLWRHVFWVLIALEQQAPARPRRPHCARTGAGAPTILAQGGIAPAVVTFSRAASSRPQPS